MEGGCCVSLFFLSTVQPVPYPFLLPCCLPKPIQTPRTLHSHFPYISAAAHPGFNLMELRELGLPPLATTLHASANGWLHKSAAGWDLNNIGQSLFEDVKPPEVQGVERRVGRDTEVGERDWTRGTNKYWWTGFRLKSQNTHSFSSLCCYSLSSPHDTQILYLLRLTMMCMYLVFSIDTSTQYTAFLLSAVHATVGESHL